MGNVSQEVLTSTVDELVRCLQAVLNTPAITAETSIFQAGGTSLHAEIYAQTASFELGRRITFTDIFLHPTPAALARSLDGDVAPVAKDEKSLPASAADPHAWHPASEVQIARLDSIKHAAANGLANMARPQLLTAGFELRGELDAPALRATITEIITRHEALRTRFVEQDGTWQLTISPEMFELIEVDSPAWSTEAIHALVWEPFVLDGGVLARFILVHKDEDLHELWVTLEHMITDGVASRLLLTDLADTYAERTGATRSAPAPVSERSSYQYAYHEAAAIDSEQGRRAEAHWREGFEEGTVRAFNHPRLLPLIADVLGTVQLSHSLGPDYAGTLRSAANRHGTTIHTIVVSALALAAASVTGDRDVSMYWNISGRDDQQFATVSTWTARFTGVRIPSLPNDLLPALETTREAVSKTMAYSFYPISRLARVLQHPDRFPPYDRPRLVVHVDADPEQRPVSRPATGFGNLESRPISSPIQQAILGYTVSALLEYTKDGPVLAVRHREGILNEADAQAFLDAFVNYLRQICEA